MKSKWLPSIFLISILLLTLLKLEEKRFLMPFFKAQRTYKLSNFEAAKKTVRGKDLELLELWESMLTGRSAPVARWIKDQYKDLGLNHLFTPSGFHLSAVMLPFMKLIKVKSWQIFFLGFIGLGIFSLVGQGALKRMVMIKIDQAFLGQKLGFAVALVMDMMIGSFSDSPLSFTYSFLFLGIIYSKSSYLFFWFFLGQCLIAFFTGDHISPLNLILSPLLNLAFAVSMPVLFILAIPLAQWQLFMGLKILGVLQGVVATFAKISSFFPSWEINTWVLLCFLFLCLRRKRMFLAVLFLLPFGLNSDFKRLPSFGNYDFVPQGRVLRIVSHESGETVYWSDGKCKRELVRGTWWEKCSPKRRRSTRKKS